MPTGERQKLITKMVAKVLGETAIPNAQFDWIINKHLPIHFGKRYTVIEQIFCVLNGNNDGMLNKRIHNLRCDAYFGGKYNFIFEFDEIQHFTTARSKTFNHYPNNYKSNFPLSHWQMLCFNNKERADKYRNNKRTKDFDFVGGENCPKGLLRLF